MTTGTKAKPSLRQRAVHEVREFLVLSAYLYITLGAVILVKAAALHAHGLEVTPWGAAIVKAMVLAKFMLAGRALGIGERAMDGPLIWPTLHKTAAFLVLLVVLTLVEEAVVGLLHGEAVATSLGNLLGPRLPETIAGIVIMLLVLFPYFAFRVLDGALGKGRLWRMFFIAGPPSPVLSSPVLSSPAPLTPALPDPIPERPGQAR